MIEVVAEALLPSLFWLALVSWVFGALLDIPILRHAAAVMLVMFVLWMLIVVVWGVWFGVEVPVRFCRRFRTYSRVEKLVYTPLIALLILIMLALIASAIALATHYARGIY